ncbi:hypothetical protein BpHYR1_005047, partial [Brachionus plicatilis]
CEKNQKKKIMLISRSNNYKLTKKIILFSKTCLADMNLALIKDSTNFLNEIFILIKIIYSQIKLQKQYKLKIY